jgi:AbrB family looped-hinge helix DNA binding protein
MARATISAKFQVVIPKEVRRELQLAPGQKVQVFAKNGHILIVPVRPLSELRGFVKGIELEGFRDEGDRH